VLSRQSPVTANPGSRLSGMRPPMLYEQTDIPEGMTCAQYRRARRPARRHHVRLRFWRGGRP